MLKLTSSCNTAYAFTLCVYIRAKLNSENIIQKAYLNSESTPDSQSTGCLAQYQVLGQHLKSSIGS